MNTPENQKEKLKEKQKSKQIIGIVLILILLGVVVFWWQKHQKKQNINYTEGVIKKGELLLTVEATGTVQPENRLEVKAPIAGRVEEVLAKEGDVVKKGQILAWMSSNERAALLDAARAKGDEELKRWSELYRPTPVIAPSAGVIILRSLGPGQTFTTSDAIIVISDRLVVKGQVDETDLASVTKGVSAIITLDAYPEKKIPAKVIHIAFEAQTINNVTTYLIDVLPESTPSFMRAGMTANITFFVETKKDILLIPNEAIIYKNGQSYLLMNQNGPEVPITLGATDGKSSELVKGGQEGETFFIAEEPIKGKGQLNSGPFFPQGGGGNKGRRP